jgi:6-pyruvoyltetrahydropterin/6-carboxytetrahydropterin synthase
MPVVELACDFAYESAHWLPMVPQGHQCGRMHGHSYVLTVIVSGEVRPDGFVVDFADVKDVVNPLVKQWDHHCLNDFMENPTVEHQLVLLWDALKGPLPGLAELRLRETAKHTATYRG